MRKKAKMAGKMVSNRVTMTVKKNGKIKVRVGKRTTKGTIRLKLKDGKFYRENKPVELRNSREVFLGTIKKRVSYAPEYDMAFTVNLFRFKVTKDPVWISDVVERKKEVRENDEEKEVIRRKPYWGESWSFYVVKYNGTWVKFKGFLLEEHEEVAIHLDGSTEVVDSKYILHVSDIEAFCLLQEIPRMTDVDEVILRYE